MDYEVIDWLSYEADMELSEKYNRFYDICADEEDE